MYKGLIGFMRLTGLKVCSHRITHYLFLLWSLSPSPQLWCREICLCNKYAPQMPLVCHMPKFISLHLWEKYTTYEVALINRGPITDTSCLSSDGGFRSWGVLGPGTKGSGSLEKCSLCQEFSSPTTWTGDMGQNSIFKAAQGYGYSKHLSWKKKLPL